MNPTHQSRITNAIRLSDLLSRAGNDWKGPTDSDPMVHDVCADSREVGEAALFLAVPGTTFDGHAFAQDAVSRGACAVVADKTVDLRLPVPVIHVPDVRQAAARLAGVFWGLDRIQDQGGLLAVGITGTNGKSTTVYMLREILAAAGRRPAMLGTIGYDLVGRRIKADLTTPDAITLAQHLAEAHTAGATDVVMEVSSHSLQQRRTDGIRYSAAVFTNLTRDHLDYHETQEDYLVAKRRLFDGLTSDAFAVVNADDPVADRMIENCQGRIVRYGLEKPADLHAEIISESRAGNRFVIHSPFGQIEIDAPMVGRHNVANALAAAATAMNLGISPDQIVSGLNRLASVPGRLERVATGALGFDVFVDYAHTDDALRNALAALRPLTRGRLWCVFGCGGDRDRAKRPLMAQAVAGAADRFVITSDNPRTEDPVAIIDDIEAGLTTELRDRGQSEPDRAKAIEMAVRKLEPHDTLLIAGKGHEDYQILGSRRVDFDDVKIARLAIERR